LGKIEVIIKKKRKIAHYYHQGLKDLECIQLPIEKQYAKNVYWMYHIILKGNCGNRRSAIMSELRERGIETREGFIPYNMQEIFINRGWTSTGDCPKANLIAYSSFYLPSGVSLTNEELQYTVVNLKMALESA
jgi:perosamine synthetase